MAVLPSSRWPTSCAMAATENYGDLVVALGEAHGIFVVNTGESRKEGNTEERVLGPIRMRPGSTLSTTSVGSRALLHSPCGSVAECRSRPLTRYRTPASRTLPAFTFGWVKVAAGACALLLTSSFTEGLGRFPLLRSKG